MAITPPNPPRNVEPGDPVTASGHNALVAAAEAFWRSSLARAHHGAMGLHQAPDPRLAAEPAFIARITEAHENGRHGWKEQVWDASSAKWQDMPEGRSGSPGDGPAFEVNGREGVPGDTIVVMHHTGGEAGWYFFSTAAGMDESPKPLNQASGDQADAGTWDIQQQGEKRGVLLAVSRLDPESGRVFTRTVGIDSLGNVVNISAETFLGELPGAGPSPDEKVKVDIHDTEEGFLRRSGGEQTFHKVVGDNETSIDVGQNPPAGEGWLSKQVLVDGQGRRQLVDRHVGPAPSRYYFEFLRVTEVDLDACPHPWFDWTATRIEVDATGHVQTQPFTGNPLEEIDS